MMTAVAEIPRACFCDPSASVSRDAQTKDNTGERCLESLNQARKAPTVAFVMYPDSILAIAAERALAAAEWATIVAPTGIGKLRNLPNVVMATASPGQHRLLSNKTEQGSPEAQMESTQPLNL